MSRKSNARETILLLLKTRGPQTAAQLADALAITPIAVRSHLHHLETEGLILHAPRKGRVGRPSKVWRLSGEADARFPNAHGEFSAGLLQAVRTVFGDPGVRAVLEAWARAESQRFLADTGRSDASLTERVAALVEHRREQGYMAENCRDEDGCILLIENHCPIGTAACACESVCEAELVLFSEVLGDEVTVERLEHIPGGDRRCVYRIVERPDA